MALIGCPQCGKNISDSAEKCPHCGANPKALREKEETSKQFNSLPYGEQKALEKQFDSVNAYAQKHKRTHKTLLIVGWTLLIIAVAAVVCSLVWFKKAQNDVSFTQTEYDEVVEDIQEHIDNRTTDSIAFKELVNRLNEMNAERDAVSEKADKVMPVIAVPAGIAMMVSLFCCFKQKFGMTKQNLTYAVYFREWLKNEKGLELQLHPSPKEKAILDQITEEKKCL